MTMRPRLFRPRTFFSGIILVRLMDYASPILPIPYSGRGTEKEQFNYIYLCGTCFTVMVPVRQQILLLCEEKLAKNAPDAFGIKSVVS